MIGDPIGTASFDDSEVGKVFYDSLCQCIPRWSESDPPKQDCYRREDCCGHEVDADLRCFTNPVPVAGETRHQCTNCRSILQTCNGDDDCCGNGVNHCYKPEGAGGAGYCIPKSPLCGWCTEDDDCLSTEGNELECSGNTCIDEANTCDDTPDPPE